VNVSPPSCGGRAHARRQHTGQHTREVRRTNASLAPPYIALPPFSRGRRDLPLLPSSLSRAGRDAALYPSASPTHRQTCNGGVPEAERAGSQGYADRSAGSRIERHRGRRGAGQKGEGRGRFRRRRVVNSAGQRRTTKSTRCRSRAKRRRRRSGQQHPEVTARATTRREVSKHGDADPRKRRRGPYPSSSSSSSSSPPLLLPCSRSSVQRRINRREERAVT